MLFAIATAAHPEASDRIPPAAGESAASNPRIAFVHLRLASDRVELVELKVVSGRFKPSPEPAGNRILLEVVSVAGKVLWHGWMEDPASGIREGGHPLSRRHLATTNVAAPVVEATARVPFVEEGQTVRITRMVPVPNATAQSRPLGSVELRER